MRYEIGNVLNISKGFEWKIPDFFSLSTDANDWYNSPIFSFAGEFWYLTYFPNVSRKNDTKVHFRFSLSRHASGPPISLKFSFCLKSSEGEKINKKYVDHIFEKERIGCGMLSFMVRSELIARKSKLLPSDILTVNCTIKCSKSAEKTSDNVTAQCSYCKVPWDPGTISLHEKKCLDKPIKCPECSDVTVLRYWYDHECQKTKSEDESCTSAFTSVLEENKVLRDFKELFLKKEDCDVIIKVKEQEFPAHRLILQARSSVLASTFRNNMKERATGVLNIEDCDPSSFSDFLCFLYCGNTEVISEANVFSLFTVADKYDVQDLRAKCVQFMIDNLSINTFCDTITLALRHSETELVKLTTDFFTKNAPKIILTVEWQSFLAQNPTESNELFVKFCTSSSSNSSK